MSGNGKSKGKTNKYNSYNMFLYEAYQKLYSIPIIKTYLYKINKTYKLIMPTDNFTNIISTMKLALRSVLIMMLIFLVCMISGRFHFYGYIIIAIMLVIINGEIVNSSFWKMELKLLRQLENYLGEVRHYFHVNTIIEDAIYDSLENIEYEIGLHINLIYEIIMDNDKNKSEKYKELAPNKFFMIFMALCELVIKYGDSVRDDKSLFLENINSLRDEIRTEILKREKISYIFSGLITISLIPPFTLKIIEKWGISNLPELTDYYDGRFGLIASVAICLISMLVYFIINRLKDTYRYHAQEHYILERIGSIRFVNEILMGYMCRKPYRVRNMNDKLRRASESITVKQHILRKWCIQVLSTLILVFLTIYAFMLPSVGEKEFILSGIQVGLLCIAVIMAIIMVSYFVSCIPDILLLIKACFLKASMEDEVSAYHSIIIMLMNIKRMSVEIILEWLENFSEVFKISLGECLMNYSYDDEMALDKLKEAEPYPPFVRIVENLQVSDSVGIEKAFDEIYSQRSYFLEKRKQDNEITIANKGAIARVIAFIPMIMTIGLYLIIPFVMQSLTELTNYTTGI